MRKKIKVVIITVILVACSFLYAHIDKVTRIYDKNIDTSNYISMGIRNGEVFEQSFVVEENILNGIEIMCLVGGDAENTELTYELVEAEGNEVVRSGEIDTKEIVSGKFYRISFDKIEDCKDKKYMFSMRQKISQENSGIAFYYAPNVEKNTRLKIDGQTVDGTTVMRGISHRFDLETFIVLLSFILYIILFMKFLIKLFK